MQKIKKFFKFITSKEFLMKVILIQIVILLFVIMTGNLTIKIKNSSWSGFKVKGDIDTNVKGDLTLDSPIYGFQISK